MIKGFFGLPGSGKTTVLTMIAQKELKKIKKKKSKYTQVLTNFYCKGCKIVKFDYLGKYDLSNSLILIDEITLFADSRDFKTFTNTLKEFFLLHRHYKIDIIYFCQQYDGLDKKIRDCTQELYYCKKLFFLTKCKRIYRMLDIDKNTHDIVYGYRFPTFIERIINLIIPLKITFTCFRPKYYKYFDSYECKKLPEIKIESW